MKNKFSRNVFKLIYSAYLTSTSRVFEIVIQKTHLIKLVAKTHQRQPTPHPLQSQSENNHKH